jgi:hypothetical protein
VTATTTVRRGSATKLVASAGVLAAAVAVAGLGTLGGFTDSTAPVDASVETGVVSIDVAAAGSTNFEGGMLMPGDSRTQLLDLVNDGDTALGSVSMSTYASQSSVLDSDRVNGLQLAVQVCADAWSGSTCAGGAGTVYEGPFVVSDLRLAAPASATPGRVDHLRLVVSLPSTASGASFQDVSSTLNLVFTGTQRDGEAR